MKITFGNSSHSGGHGGGHGHVTSKPQKIQYNHTSMNTHGPLFNQSTANNPSNISKQPKDDDKSLPWIGLAVLAGGLLGAIALLAHDK